MKRTWVLVLLLSAALAGSVLVWAGVRREQEFRRLIALGDTSLGREQTSVAIEAFSGAVALKPDSMLGFLKRGDTYRRRSDFPAALRDLRRAAELDTAAPRPLELLGDVNMSMGGYDQAAADYGRVVAIDDRSPRVLYKLALAHYRNAHAASAIDPLRAAIAIEERFVEGHHLLAMCLRDERRDAEALRSLMRAIALNPAFSPARAELADLYRTLGRHRERIEQLEALAALEPARPDRLIAVGLADARLGRHDAAILTLGRAAERYPQEPAVFTALGRVWLEAAEARGDRAALRKAIEALEPVAVRESASGDMLSLYGRALFLSGDAERAERVLTQATSRLPVDPSAFLYLAAAAQRLAHEPAAMAARSDYATLAKADAADTQAQVSNLLGLSQRLRLTDAASSPDRARRGDRLPGS
jgi:tetratricopeptide (TPR) repeat protein